MLKVKKLIAKILAQLIGLKTTIEASKSVAISSTSMTTYAEGAAITVTKGIYLVIYFWNFTGSGSGARQIQAAIKRNNESTLLGPHRITTGYGNYSILNGAEIVEATADNTKFTVVASSDKTSTSASTTIKAIKLGGVLKSTIFKAFSLSTSERGWAVC